MKRNRKNELDVDFIDDQNRQLTDEEAKVISAYIKAQKAKTSKINVAPKKSVAKRVKSLM